MESRTPPLSYLAPPRTPCLVICCPYPNYWSRAQFSSVTQSYRTLCDPMDCSTPGFHVHHQLPGFAQTHVHPFGDAIQPSHPLSSPFTPASFNWSTVGKLKLGCSVDRSQSEHHELGWEKKLHLHFHCPLTIQFSISFSEELTQHALYSAVPAALFPVGILDIFRPHQC